MLGHFKKDTHTKHRTQTGPGFRNGAGWAARTPPLSAPPLHEPYLVRVRVTDETLPPRTPATFRLPPLQVLGVEQVATIVGWVVERPRASRLALRVPDDRRLRRASPKRVDLCAVPPPRLQHQREPATAHGAPP